MTHFKADMVQRTHDEIEDMCKEMRACLDTKATTYESLTYEEGILAAVRWIFFKTAAHPCDGKDRQLAHTVERVAHEIDMLNHAQAREGSDV